mgnify:CR=1 FL=1
MPDISFSLSVDQYKTSYAYELNPVEYMMTPKVDNNVRAAMCDLGLFNLDAIETDETDDDTNEFALG